MHRRAVGEVLHSEREPLEALEKLKVEMGSYDFSAQYQQAPVPAGGNMIQWKWFGFFTGLPLLRDGGAVLVQSWDTASSKNELASYSVGITAFIDKTGTIWVLDLVRGRWAFPDLQRKVIEGAQRYRPQAILIEDYASGTALQQALKQERFAVIPIKPKGDKVMRLHAHTAALEAGKVLLPKDAPWLDDFRCEVLAFPHGKHDDQVDALSQLMTWHQDRQKRTYGVHRLRW